LSPPEPDLELLDEPWPRELQISSQVREVAVALDGDRLVRDLTIWA